MDISLVIKRRMRDLGLEQRGLAAAAQVTESYVSQLLARKKAPPAPSRTDLYPKMEAFLQLPRGELARLAEVQRREELKKKVAGPPQPLFPRFRALVLRKCMPQTQLKVAAILEKETFGELERLVTQKLFDVARGVANDPEHSSKWLRLVSRTARQNQEQTRITVLEFLDTGVFSGSVEHCVSYLAPLIEAWDINLETFAMEVVLDGRIAPDRLKRFEFIEREPEQPSFVEAGLEEFLRDKSLSGDATVEEIEFLKTLRFKDKRPLPIYYYRELQNLRDPVHFRAQ